MTVNLRHTVSTWRGLPLLRAFWHRHIRCYPYEVCHRCGRPVKVVWHAPDKWWLKVNGKHGGVLCVPCFDSDPLTRNQLEWWPRLLSGDDETETASGEGSRRG